MMNHNFKSGATSLFKLLLVLPSSIWAREQTLNDRRSVRVIAKKVINPRQSINYWIPLETHGLMLSHYQARGSSAGVFPLSVEDAEERENDKNKASVFSPSLAHLTSSYRDFVIWNEGLVSELAESPWLGEEPIHSRDVVTRESGEVILSRRSDGSEKFQLAVSGHQDEVHYSNHEFKRMLVTRKASPKRTHTAHHQVKNHKQKHSKSLSSVINKASSQLKDVMKGATISTKITWYTGQDLLNPYCVRKSKWAPTDDSLVIAVTQKWKSRPSCGDFFELKVVTGKQQDQVGTSVIARVVDLCGGCKPEIAHADLSKAAFTKLFNLDVGVVSGLSMRKVPPPKVWSTRLYGPRIL